MFVADDPLEVGCADVAQLTIKAVEVEACREPPRVGARREQEHGGEGAGQ